MHSWLVAKNVFCEVTVTLTFDHRNLINSSLSPSGRLCQIWRNSLKCQIISGVPEIYRVHKNGLDVRRKFNRKKKFPPAGGRWLVLTQLFSTWLPGHKLSNFTAKHYTTRCFWKHLRREIGITVAEYWLIFDQRCWVWQYDRSSWVPWAVIDSCCRDSSALIVFFLRGCETLKMP